MRKPHVKDAQVTDTSPTLWHYEVLRKGDYAAEYTASIKKDHGDLANLRGPAFHFLLLTDHLFVFTTPTFTFSPSNSSSTTDAFSGTLAKDNLDVSVSAVM